MVGFCKSSHIYTYTHICIYTYTHIHTYTHMHIHIYTHTHIHTYAYTHIHTVMNVLLLQCLAHEYMKYAAGVF